jgi:nucleoside-diphosphate kinase
MEDIKKIEKTLVMIKPDGIKIADKIFSELDKLGKRIKMIKINKVNISKILEHYAEPIQRHGEHLVGKIRNFFGGKPIILALYEGEKIIQLIREKIGDINPKKAKPGTIRGNYCNDDLDLATKQNRFVRNAVHASSSQKEAENEFKVWREYLD